MSLLTLTVVLALVATVITLAWGLGSMAVGGSYDEKHSEQLMFTRIGIQIFAFVMLLAAVYLSVS
ncbi:MAG: twin transmembrane helix small protein [Gammaproteobacteria bacterium]|nr:twin transmembrane helix small protein [Gammaproteobacteria bacterium]MBT8134840.1 twin transmembrane helix small protein [Gammaproteobacteria bacterium]NNJ49023.1 twin transmembrane helix small protein [Gammaproteobacteria bacterium]